MPRLGVRFPLSPPTAIPHIGLRCPRITPNVVAERAPYLVPSRVLCYPPLSRVKCGNMCGNRFRHRGTANWRCQQQEQRLSREPGRYSDGGGLHLFISKRGAKSWVQRITIDGRRRDVGLGGFPSGEPCSGSWQGRRQPRRRCRGPRPTRRKARARDAHLQGGRSHRLRGQQATLAQRQARRCLDSDPGAARHTGLGR